MVLPKILVLDALAIAAHELLDRERVAVVDIQVAKDLERLRVREVRVDGVHLSRQPPSRSDQCQTPTQPLGPVPAAHTGVSASSHPHSRWGRCQHSAQTDDVWTAETHRLLELPRLQVAAAIRVHQKEYLQAKGLQGITRLSF